MSPRFLRVKKVDRRRVYLNILSLHLNNGNNKEKKLTGSIKFLFLIIINVCTIDFLTIGCIIEQ